EKGTETYKFNPLSKQIQDLVSPTKKYRHITQQQDRDVMKQQLQDGEWAVFECGTKKTSDIPTLAVREGCKIYLKKFYPKKIRDIETIMVWSGLLTLPNITMTVGALLAAGNLIYAKLKKKKQGQHKSTFTMTKIGLILIGTGAAMKCLKTSL
ncbi:hypothetical protein ACFLY6_03180, partial [Candidatus Dependentiae bacterium]